MENIIIRNVEKEDIPSIVDIQIEGWKTAYKDIIDENFLNSMNKNEKIEKRMKDYKENGFIVAELNGEIVGFCRYIDRNKYTQDLPEIDCELMALYVKSDLKYNGIGTKLFQFVINEFRRKNKTKMILWCLKDNEPSKKFYTKMGGEIIKEKEIEIGEQKYFEVGFKYNINSQFSRTELLIGKEGIEKLQNAKVAIFGTGGVGSFVVEGLARAGIGNFILVDNDKVSLTNLNRQIIATHKTIGKLKVEVEKERILEINPNANVEIHQEFFMPDSKEILDNTIDYIVDAVDTITAKIELVVRADKLSIPIISSMGTGNKLDPTKFEVTDIYKTSICPLAKVMRKELKARGIKSLKVVYSKEEPIKLHENIYDIEEEETGTTKKQVPGSISFVPSVAGLIIAGEVIKDIIKR